MHQLEQKQTSLLSCLRPHHTQPLNRRPMVSPHLNHHSLIPHTGVYIEQPRSLPWAVPYPSNNLNSHLVSSLSLPASDSFFTNLERVFGVSNNLPPMSVSLLCVYGGITIENVHLVCCRGSHYSLGVIVCLPRGLLPPWSGFVLFQGYY